MIYVLWISVTAKLKSYDLDLRYTFILQKKKKKKKILFKKGNEAYNILLMMMMTREVILQITLLCHR